MTCTITLDVFFRERGYGFGSHLAPDGVRTNVFVHIKDVVQGYPTPGASIECDLERNSKGFVARNAKVVSIVKSVDASVAALAGGR